MIYIIILALLIFALTNKIVYGETILDGIRFGICIPIMGVEFVGWFIYYGCHNLTVFIMEVGRGHK